MNILYTFLNFNGFTGSELYYYELAKEMVKLGHKVTILSNCSGEIMARAKSAGIKCCNFKDPIQLQLFDIIHASHKEIVEKFVTYHLPAKIVVTCHSELLKEEKIADHSEIDHFIGIRPSIIDMLPEGKRSLIFNPIDNTRFNKDNARSKDYIFFPGTINYLRVNALVKLIQTYGDKFKIVCMGENHYPGVEVEGVEFIKPHWNIEKVIKGSRFVAGIIKGRTYMEAAMCGKYYLDYQVDDRGVVTGIKEYLNRNILDFGLDVPIEQFYSNNVAKQIESLYKELK